MSTCLRLLALLGVCSGARMQERGLYWDTAPYDSSVSAADVKDIHIVFSNHLDVGFNSRAWCDGGNCTPPEQLMMMLRPTRAK